MFKKKKKTTSKEVKFSCKMPKAKSISVTGSFNKWSKRKNKMKKSTTGLWSCSVKLKPGRYEYRFVVNGSEWANDPKAKECCPNDQGGLNCVVHV